MTDEKSPDITGQEKAKKELQERQYKSAQVLQKHFSVQPDGVLVATISQGRLQADVAGFDNIGEMLFAKALIDKFSNEAFEQSIIKGHREHQQPQPQPEQVQ